MAPFAPPLDPPLLVGPFHVITHVGSSDLAIY
jgi:hypothetical protein